MTSGFLVDILRITVIEKGLLLSMITVKAWRKASIRWFLSRHDGVGDLVARDETGSIRRGEPACEEKR